MARATSLLPADRAIARWDASRQLSLSTRQRARATHALVIACRQRLGRRRLICGGAAPDVHQLVKLRLALGVLGELRGVGGIAPGTGESCIVCEEPILAPAVAYALAGRRNESVHAPCYEAWLEALTRGRDGASGLMPQRGHEQTPVERARVAVVRSRLQEGALWRGRPRRSWFRVGTVRPCHGCGALIGQKEIQVDLEVGALRLLRFHSECYVAWRDEVAHDGQPGRRR